VRSKRQRESATSTHPSAAGDKSPQPNHHAEQQQQPQLTAMRAHVLAQLDCPLPYALKQCTVTVSRLPSLSAAHGRQLGQALAFVTRALVERGAADIATALAGGTALHACTSLSPTPSSHGSPTKPALSATPGARATGCPAAAAGSVLSRTTSLFQGMIKAQLLTNADTARELVGLLAASDGVDPALNPKHRVTAVVILAGCWCAASPSPQAAAHAVLGALRGALTRSRWEAAVDDVHAIVGDAATGSQTPVVLPSNVAEALLTGVSLANDRRLGFTALGASQQGTPLLDRQLSPTCSASGWSPRGTSWSRSPHLSPQLSPRWAMPAVGGTKPQTPSRGGFGGP
jgi:hypothetical protein